ncbi:MAG: hypothetical protein A2103_00490 [Gammaproteobacteria bacterium GWF2_41_13]|nr:MAG: hypothetical protein A2103_00490 [Gammaproteobacteria bacterium GWF2_41_13]
MPSLQKLRIATFVILIGFLTAIFFDAWMTHLGYPYPANSFLFNPANRFMDFFNTYHFTRAFDYQSSALAVYFPLAYWVFAPFALIPADASFFLYNIVFCSYIYFYMMLYTKTVKEQIGSSLAYHHLLMGIIFLSYPILYCLDRGNLENLLFIFTSVSLLFFIHRKYTASAIFLSIAIGMKLYPMVFLLLFLKERRYKELTICVMLTILLSLLSLALLHGGFVENWRILMSRIMPASKEGMLDGSVMAGIRQTASLFGMFKVMILVVLAKTHHVVDMNLFLRHLDKFSHQYRVISMAALLMLSGYLLKFERVFWKQTMILVLIIILFPAISFNYKFIYLFIPFAAFLCQEPKQSIYDKIYLALFLVLLIPKNYYVFPVALVNYPSAFDPNDLIVSISVFIDPIVMVTFLILIMIERLTGKENQKIA